MESDLLLGPSDHERQPVDDGRCFACGPESAHGLRLQFRPSSESEVVAHTTLSDHFQGWVGFAHGGVVCMLLDEAMAHAAAQAGRCGVTAGLRVRFRKPTPLGRPLIITGRLMASKRLVLTLCAQVHDEQGSLLATAQGDFMDRGPLDPTTIFGRMLGEY